MLLLSNLPKTVLDDKYLTLIVVCPNRSLVPCFCVQAVSVLVGLQEYADWSQKALVV